MSDAAKLQSSIVNQIIDGSITIDSIGEFQSMLRIFPDNPHLHRALADLLVRRKSFAAAADYFDKTATLFIQAGMTVQAVAARMLQWQIVKPSFRALKSFYHDVLENTPRATALQMFFTGLSFHEMIAMLTRMERIVLPPGKLVKKFGDPENNLFMLVSGILKRHTYSRTKPAGRSEEARESQATEFFGDVYPLAAEHHSQSSVETVSRVELLRISRENLIELSKRFPSIEPALGDLHQNQQKLAGAQRIPRQTRRHAIPVRIKLEVRDVSPETPRLKLKGLARDMSIGGLCALLDGTVQYEIAHRLTGKSVTIFMSLSDEAMAISIRGHVVWTQLLNQDGNQAQALGIQFNKIPPNLSGLLMVFADNLHHAR